MSGIEQLGLTAEVELKAAEGQPPRIEILAYGGGLMMVPGFGPLVINASGVTLPESVPLLADHKNSLDTIVGTGTPSTDGRRILVSGQLATSTDAAQRILAMHRDGVRLQASVGVTPDKITSQAAGHTIRANGQSLTHSQPFRFVESGTLKEVSIVAIGADSTTTVTIAAKGESEDLTMTTTEDTIQATREREAAETERIGEIRRICASHHPTIEAQAIREGWDAAKTELHILRAERERTEETTTVQAGGPGIHSRSRTPGSNDVLSAALMIRAGYGDAAAKSFGEGIADQADRFRSMSLVDMCRASLAMDGQTVPSDRGEMIQAALSYISMPRSLGDSLGRVVQEAYRMAPATWRSFATIKSASNFKTHRSLRLEVVGDLEELPGGGEIRHAEVAEGDFPWSIDTYAKMLSFSRKDIINDDLHMLDEIGPRLGVAAVRAISDLVWSTIIASTTHWTSGNANLLTGGSSALSIDSFSNAVQKLRDQTDANDSNLDLEPNMLVCSSSLETVARQILESSELSRDTTVDSLPTGNAMRQAAGLAIESRLTNTTKFSGADPASWWLFSHPTNLPCIVGFLDGKDMPTIEFFDMQSTVNRLQVSWRVYHDFGFALGDPVASVKADGS